jgi:hypothetical protein
MSASRISLSQKSTGFVLALCLLMVALMAGCRTAPVMDMGPTAIGVNATQEQVKKAILRAAAGLGWSIKEEGPGLLLGTLVLRTHVAVVEIPYSTKSFSIQYKESQNLNYDETNKTIHSNYMGWIKNLHEAINQQLALL